MPKIRKHAVNKQTKKVVKRRKTGSILDRVTPITYDKGVKLNVYGRSGTGKTTFWATFPKPILALIASGGKNPGELRSIDTPENREKIEQFSLQKTSDIGGIVEALEDDCEYKTVVLDHATGLQDMTMKEILGIDKLPEQASWGMAKQQDWGQCALQMKEMLRNLLDLPVNVIIAAQEREFNIDSDSDLIMPYVGSALTPSVTGWLNPACDFIVQTFKRQKTKEVTGKIGKKLVTTKKREKGVEYCLRTGPDETYTTKFRVPKGTELPDVIVDPSYQKIRRLLGE